MKSFGAESGLLTSDSAAGIDFKKIQQERARHKDAFDEANLANELLIGHEQENPEFQARKAKQKAEQEKHIEVWATEIATLESEAAILQGIVLNEERNAKDAKKIQQNPDSPAAALYKKSIDVRTEEIAAARASLPAELANLSADQLRVEFDAKKSELESAKELRDGLLNS